MSDGEYGDTDGLARRLHSTTDARVWAEEFCKRFALVAVGAEPAVMENDAIGIMIGWFANTIEVGRTAGAQHAPWINPHRSGIDSRGIPDA